MKWINCLFKPLIWLYNKTNSVDEEFYYSNAAKKDEIRINPATGLPMRGAFDTSGNTLGTSSSDWSNDYSRSHASNSRFNSFNNRF
ncbi:hypothetical protein ACNVED_15835 (plasmid) [Legionella sp. D16C41]|uniref:hypothetical protein n=1 Tax=Legionella sp. D16C41 TaxID=3402688 RepID=UPI003AF7793F